MQNIQKFTENEAVLFPFKWAFWFFVYICKHCFNSLHVSFLALLFPSLLISNVSYADVLRARDSEFKKRNIKSLIKIKLKQNSLAVNAWGWGRWGVRDREKSTLMADLAIA